MVVFTYYEVPSINGAQWLLSDMGLPGEPIAECVEDSCFVWRDDKFIAIWYETELMLELYGTYTTNSINFYKNRYPELQYDDVRVYSTKRW